MGLLAGLAMLVVPAGCRGLPWPTDRQGSETLSQNAQPAQSPPAVQSLQGSGTNAESASGSASPGQNAGQTASGTPIEELLDQLAQIEDLDPLARQRLADDLRQTDPALRPAVIQAFRAALSYRRQQEEGLRQGETDRPTHSALVSDAPAANGSRSRVQAESSASPQRGHGPHAPAGSALPARPADDLAAKDAAQAHSGGEAPEPPGVQSAGQRLGGSAAGAAQRGTSSQAGDRREGDARHSHIEPASYTEGRSDWQEQLAGALAALEAELRQAPASPELADKHARLRLLALVAGQREEALRPIPAVPPAVQDFWRQELYGLALWLDAQRQEDPARRAGEARQQLADALVPLGWMAPLVLRNLAFITQVQSYGDYKPFAQYVFAPEQEVLLYVEIENFASEQSPKGYHTVLEASYRIFDSRNQQVAEKQLGTTEEYCRNPRRDFFVVYHLRMPKRIYTGRHTLQLTVVDQKSKKVGQASVEFTIQEPSA